MQFLKQPKTSFLNELQYKKAAADRKIEATELYLIAKKEENNNKLGKNGALIIFLYGTSIECSLIYFCKKNGIEIPDHYRKSHNLWDYIQLTRINWKEGKFRKYWQIVSTWNTKIRYATQDNSLSRELRRNDVFIAFHVIANDLLKKNKE